MARPKPALTLTDGERSQLTTWASRPKSTLRLATRARIVLACADQPNNLLVAQRLGVCAATVGTWRKRFVTRRLDGLVDEPRPGARRRVTDADVERVVTRTLESKPANATHGSTRGMAKVAGMSQSAISRIWRAFERPPDPGRHVQALDRPVLRREGPGCGRVVPVPAGQRPRPVGR